MDPANNNSLFASTGSSEFKEIVDYYTYCGSLELDCMKIESARKYLDEFLGPKLLKRQGKLQSYILKAIEIIRGHGPIDSALSQLEIVYQYVTGLEFEDANPSHVISTPSTLSLVQCAQNTRLDHHQVEKHNKGGHGPGVFALDEGQSLILLQGCVLGVFQAYEKLNKVPIFEAQGNIRNLICVVLLTGIDTLYLCERMDNQKPKNSEKECYVILQISVHKDSCEVHGYPCGDEGYVKVCKSGTYKSHKEQMGAIPIRVEFITELIVLRKTQNSNCSARQRNRRSSRARNNHRTPESDDDAAPRNMWLRRKRRVAFNGIV